jgi:hypothetical protein
MIFRRNLLQWSLLLSVFTSVTANSGEATTSTHKSLQAHELGWQNDPEQQCGGQYVEDAYAYPENIDKKNAFVITSDHPLLSLHGTSDLSDVVITKPGQQITAKKANLYRDPKTNKINAIDLQTDVHFRQPNSLMIAKTAHFDLLTKQQLLKSVLYRTAVNYRINNPRLTPAELQQKRYLHDLTAWGEANDFSQTDPKVYIFHKATYTTCPPLTSVWHLQANTIKLDNTGILYPLSQFPNRCQTTNRIFISSIWYLQ